MTKLNLIGQRSGKLTIIEEIGRDSWGAVLWKCLCDCGNKAVVVASNLSHKKVRSCGCLCVNGYKSRTLSNGEAAFNLVYYDYKHNAEKKNLVFNLTRGEFRKITQKDCFYCGSPPQNKRKSGKGNGGLYYYTGVDRIDNSKGYTPDNVVPCCYKCNKMKGTMVQKDFKGHLLLILENWIV